MLIPSASPQLSIEALTSESTREQGYKPLTIYSPREVISHATEN